MYTVHVLRVSYLTSRFAAWATPLSGADPAATRPATARPVAIRCRTFMCPSLRPGVHADAGSRPATGPQQHRRGPDERPAMNPDKAGQSRTTRARGHLDSARCRRAWVGPGSGSGDHDDRDRAGGLLLVVGEAGPGLLLAGPDALPL